jgi:hypothetical protein
LFTASVPSNWQAVSSNNSINRSAECLRRLPGQSTLTCGVELGVARIVTRSQPGDADAIDGFVRGNDGMRSAAAGVFSALGPRGDRDTLEGRSALGGVERVDVHTTLLSNGDLFYVLTVAPDRDMGTCMVRHSIRLSRRCGINDR